MLGTLIYALCFSAYFFFTVAEPSLLDGVKVGADSITYIETAQYLQATNQFNLSNAVSLSFNYFGPVLLLLITDYNHKLIFFINTFIFLLSLAAMMRYYHFRRFWLVLLLVINPITLLSLTTVNKEIFGMTSMIYLLVFLRSRSPSHFLFALLLAVMTRWQQVLLVLLLLPYLNLIQTNQKLLRWGALIPLFVISLVYPFIGKYLNFTGDANLENVRTQFEQAGGLIPLLNRLQDNFLYWLAFVPKALLNYIGNFPRIIQVFDPKDTTDLYNRLLVGHQIMMLIVITALIFLRRFKMNRIETHIILLYSMLYCLSLSINYRYFYPIYPVFLLLLSVERNDMMLYGRKWRPRYRLIWKR